MYDFVVYSHARFTQLMDLDNEEGKLRGKTIKDYLEAQHVGVSFPREVIKTAFHYGLIENGEIWMDMLEKRNLFAHTYDELHFQRVLEKIKNEYFQAITQIYEDLGEKL